jgi:hypothetical protein
MDIYAGVTCRTNAMWYNARMAAMTKKLLQQLESWPEEDQQELAEYARDIEARRTGVYHATPEELQAIDEAERSGMASEEEVEAAFRSFRGSWGLPIRSAR